MVPAKLRRRLTTNHSHLTSKGVCYFKQLLESQNKQSKAFVKKVTFNEKSQEASYLVEEPKRKSHTVRDNLIMPACKILLSKMLQQEAA
jgi:hypothetical protein